MKTCPYGKESWPTEELADKALKQIWRRPRPGGRRMETHSYRRQQLALSLLAEGGDPTVVLNQVARVLRGELLVDGAA